MRITSLRTVPVRIPRDFVSAQGTAGLPTLLQGTGSYRWSSDYPVLYSIHFETALIQLTLEDGTEGWGEAQAPLAPEVACQIAELLLRPAVEGLEFDGTPERIAEIWERMFSTMRVRGQTGGFMADAISGVDLALWDLAGKMHGKPVSRLLTKNPKTAIPAYLSGVSGPDPRSRAEFAARYGDQGIGLVKLYFESDWEALLEVADRLPEDIEFAVDALWHLPPERGAAMAQDLDARGARFLECPFYPDEPEQHAALASAIHTPIALGESYRTVRELQPVAASASILQPDLGRCGITGSRRIATHFGKEIIPHISIAMGPQIAAALHFAAATDECRLCEFNPNVLAAANAFLAEPLRLKGGKYEVPQSPGLGVVWNQAPR